MVVVHGKVKYYTLLVDDQGNLRAKAVDKQTKSNSNRIIKAFIPDTDKRLKRLPDLQLYYDDYLSYGFTAEEASWMTGAIADAAFAGQHSMVIDQLLAWLAALTALGSQGYQLPAEIIMDSDGPIPRAALFTDPYNNVVFRNPLTSAVVTHQQLAEVEDDAEKFKELIFSLF